jgi:tetratricopeptide (TPR) repeat protein
MTVDWTALAPKPADLPAGMKYHVFISYRSVERRWVLALYDILSGLGYKVFLDQYVLTAADQLSLSLSDALDASQSAILVWSNNSEDSAWCKAEAGVLINRQNAGQGFYYVVAKVDAAPLPGFLSDKLWVDFSGQPEGPSGTNLLRVLFGLQGRPLSTEAVQMAAEIDDEMRDGLLRVKAHSKVADAQGLVELATTKDTAWTSSPMLLCEAAEGLIKLKKLPEALDILDRAIAAFPKAVRPRQLHGLALARGGNWKDAQFELEMLYESGQIGPETLGILARTWFDGYRETGDEVFLQKSRDYYQQAFAAFPSDSYTGINAASKSLMLGDKDMAAVLAAKVLLIVGDKPVPMDYWKTATIAEVLLLEGKIDAAAQMYKAAVLVEPLSTGHHETSRNQAALLLDKLDATDEQKALVLGAFPAPKAAAS